MKQIIAMGGGGFSMEPENPLLDEYILGQCTSTRPKVCFVGTASGDAEGYIESFYRAFQKFDCEPSHLSLSDHSTRHLTSFVLDKDVIYVGGGDTFRLLEQWRTLSFDKVLRQAWEHGVILAGLSAGSLCWFEESLSDAAEGEYKTLSGLGLIRGSHCPHYDSERDGRAAYLDAIRDGRIQPGLGADDGVALHYLDDALLRVVSSRPHACAYRVECVDGVAVESPITPVYLGK